MIYTGEVVNNSDPLRLGRVQVRVTEFHRGRSDQYLPWAFIVSAGGGSYDTGSAFRYPLGSSVLVAFEANNPNRPVVLGGCFKFVASSQEYGDTDDEWQADWVSWCPACDTYYDDLQEVCTACNTRTIRNTDIPQEAKDEAGRDVSVLFKLPKGATLFVDEADEGERLVLVDRAGQVFEMVSPVTEEANAENAARRGVGLVTDDTGLDYEKMAGPAYIRMMDLSGNILLLHSEEGEEKVRVENTVFGNYLEMTKTGIVIQALNGVDDEGVTIQITVSGVKVNGKYLVTEELVNWLKTYKTSLTQSTQPGSPAPIFPTALTDFNTQAEQSMNIEGMKTRL